MRAIISEEQVQRKKRKKLREKQNFWRIFFSHFSFLEYVSHDLFCEEKFICIIVSYKNINIKISPHKGSFAKPEKIKFFLVRGEKLFPFFPVYRGKKVGMQSSSQRKNFNFLRE